MKPFSKTANKWILSTLMIAALGSQYYFSVSSNSSGQFELSSTAGEELAEKLKALKATPNIKPEEFAKQKRELLIKYAPLINAENETIKKGPVVKVQPAAKPAPAPAAESAAPASAPIAPEVKPVRVELEPVKKEVVAVSAAPVVAPVKAPVVAESVPSVVAQVASAPLAVAINPSSETEGKTYKIICESKKCNPEGYVILSKANEQTALQISALLNGKLPAATSTPEAKPVAKAEPKEDECASEETSLERSRCVREKAKEAREEKKRLAQEKKEEIKQAKLDKEQEKKEMRNDAFTEKAEAIAERCHDDLKCKATALTALMNSFKGSRKVDQFAVTKAYNELISGDLKTALNSSEGKSSALDAIEAMMSSIPSEYKDLKKRAIESAKAAQISKAESVNSLYKTSNALQKQAELAKAQNKPIMQQLEATTQANNAQTLASSAEAKLRSESDQVYFSMRDGLKTSNDTSTWDYVNSTYLPDLKEVMGRLSNISGIAPDNNSAINSTISGSTTGNRGGRTGNTTNISNGGAVVGNNGNSLNGVNFGTPSSNRTVNRTGQNFKN